MKTFLTSTFENDALGLTKSLPLQNTEHREKLESLRTKLSDGLVDLDDESVNEFAKEHFESIDNLQ